MINYQQLIKKESLKAYKMLENKVLVKKKFKESSYETNNQKGDDVIFDNSDNLERRQEQKL